MEQNVFDVLKERGFIEQTTHEAEIRELLGKEKVTFYIGFDATADSLNRRTFPDDHGNDAHAESRSQTDRPAWRRNHQ